MITWKTQGVGAAQVWVQNTGAGGNATMAVTGVNGSMSFAGIEAGANRYTFTLYSVNGNVRTLLSSVNRRSRGSRGIPFYS